MREAPDERALLDLLGVDESASWDELRSAFRTAVRASHPDLHTADPDAERRLKGLNAAWESINTPGKWAAYARRTAPRPAGGRRAPRREDPAAPATGRLRVQRARAASGRVAWDVVLDGEVVANLENGGTSVVEAQPGRHTVRVSSGKRSSLPLQFDLHGGQELLVGCHQLESLRASVLSPKRSLVLTLVDSQQFG